MLQGLVYAHPPVGAEPSGSRGSPGELCRTHGARSRTQNQLKIAALAAGRFLL